MRSLAALAALLLLAGCGSDGQSEAGPTATAGSTTTPAAAPTVASGPVETDASPEALPGLPAWTAGYAAWAKLNEAPVPPRDSDPHLSTKEIFASVAAVDGVFPPGAVIVKEGVRPGKDFVGLVAAMRKIAGANPEHHDWIFVEWSREAAADPFTKLAEGAVCESCHAGVAGQDYVFTQG